MSDLELQYKRETGMHPDRAIVLSAIRSKGRWIIDSTDEEVIEELSVYGAVTIPDEDYIKWLEEKAEQTINKAL